MEDPVVMIETRDLSIGYGRRVVGAHLDLRASPGRVLALLGQNGCGKTTLLKTILGLLPPLAGEAMLDGAAVRSLPARARARLVAYVPQVHNGTFAFLVEDVVLMGRIAHRDMFSAPGEADRRAARDAMERVGVAALRAEPYTGISGGERQLVLIARALAQQSRAIVLDEPTANLDFGHQGEVLREMRALAAAGLTVVFTTHDPNHALRYADDVAAMQDGRIVAQGRAGEVLTRPVLAALYRTDVEELLADDGRRAFLPK